MNEPGIAFAGRLGFSVRPSNRLRFPLNNMSCPVISPGQVKIAQKKKTLIMIGGGDTFVEDLYSYIVPAARERNYHVLFIDLPGQGILPSLGLPWRPDAETPFKAVVDYIVSREDVDADRLAAYGISGGGYLVPRAATRETRLKAIVANSVILSFYEHWTVNTGMSKLAKMQKSLLFKLFKSMRYRPLITAFDSGSNLLLALGSRDG